MRPHFTFLSSECFCRREYISHIYSLLNPFVRKARTCFVAHFLYDHILNNFIFAPFHIEFVSNCVFACGLGYVQVSRVVQMTPDSRMRKVMNVMLGRTISALLRSRSGAIQILNRVNSWPHAPSHATRCRPAVRHSCDHTTYLWVESVSKYVFA